MGNWKSISALSVNNNMASAKIEVEKPTYDRYILDENNIFIPDRYLTRMAHNGLLEKFIDLVAAVNIETEKMNSILFKLKRGHETAYDDVDLKRFQIDNNDEPCNMKTCDTDPSTSALVQYKHDELVLDRTYNLNIDLSRAEQATSMLTHHELSGYQPRTLPDKNNGRYAYLPIFPTALVGVDDCLLLANVPETHLTPQEMARCQHGVDTSDALRMMNTYKYIDTFSLSEQDAEELALRLQVCQSIITFNADRLRCICGAKSRFEMEGLFYGKVVPQARYVMLPCGHLFCLCCHPLNSYKKSQTWSVIEFDSSSRHQCANEYTTYLNCPAYDYVDSTAATLPDAMAYHREHGNRIIHEKLTGSPVFRGSLLDPHEHF
ncbi:unnamed protein product [Rotaria sp. Silwood1]|nr:unnamed protein product [Rotaria sp. Silwood1]